MTHWRIGQRVVCVGHFEQAKAAHPALCVPQEGRVYTIRSLEAGEDGEIGLRLVGIENTPRAYGSPPDYPEPAFAEASFSPLEAGETDISVFESILADVNARAPARRPPADAYLNARAVLRRGYRLDVRDLVRRGDRAA